MVRAKVFGALMVAAVLLLVPGAAAAQTRQQKPLTNADIVQMVAGGLPESTIIASMQANPTRFDVTPAALMELNKAHVTAAIMDAMVAAAVQATQNEAAEPPPQPHTARTRPEDAAGVEDPSVTLVVGDAREALPVERTQVAETTAKGNTLAELSRDKAVDEAVQAGMSEATERAAGSVVGSTVGQTAGGMLGGILSGGGRSRKVTYLWSVAGTSTSFTLPSDLPTFEASPGNIIGVRRDEYAPVLVKLTPLEQARLIGATEGKESAGSSSALDWPVYTGFMEDRVATRNERLSNGTWKLSAQSPLPPGEYAIVFRPVSRDKKFSGADVARNQGDGVLFTTIWSFAVR